MVFKVQNQFQQRTSSVMLAEAPEIFAPADLKLEDGVPIGFQNVPVGLIDSRTSTRTEMSTGIVSTVGDQIFDTEFVVGLPGDYVSRAGLFQSIRSGLLPVGAMAMQLHTRATELCQRAMTAPLPDLARNVALGVLPPMLLGLVALAPDTALAADAGPVAQQVSQAIDQAWDFVRTSGMDTFYKTLNQFLPMDSALENPVLRWLDNYWKLMALGTLSVSGAIGVLGQYFSPRQSGDYGSRTAMYVAANFLTPIALGLTVHGLVAPMIATALFGSAALAPAVAFGIFLAYSMVSYKLNHGRAGEMAVEHRLAKQFTKTGENFFGPATPVYGLAALTAGVLGFGGDNILAYKTLMGGAVNWLNGSVAGGMLDPTHTAFHLGLLGMGIVYVTLRSVLKARVMSDSNLKDAFAGSALNTTLTTVFANLASDSQLLFIGIRAVMTASAFGMAGLAVVAASATQVPLILTTVLALGALLLADTHTVLHGLGFHPAQILADTEPNRDNVSDRERLQYMAGVKKRPRAMMLKPLTGSAEIPFATVTSMLLNEWPDMEIVLCMDRPPYANKGNMQNSLETGRFVEFMRRYQADIRAKIQPLYADMVVLQQQEQALLTAGNAETDARVLALRKRMRSLLNEMHTRIGRELTEGYSKMIRVMIAEDGDGFEGIPNLAGGEMNLLKVYEWIKADYPQVYQYLTRDRGQEIKDSSVSARIDKGFKWLNVGEKQKEFTADIKNRIDMRADELRRQGQTLELMPEDMLSGDSLMLQAKTFMEQWNRRFVYIVRKSDKNDDMKPAKVTNVQDPMTHGGDTRYMVWFYNEKNKQFYQENIPARWVRTPNPYYNFGLPGGDGTVEPEFVWVDRMNFIKELSLSQSGSNEIELVDNTPDASDGGFFREMDLNGKQVKVYVNRAAVPEKTAFHDDVLSFKGFVYRGNATEQAAKLADYKVWAAGQARPTGAFETPYGTPEKGGWYLSQPELMDLNFWDFYNMSDCEHVNTATELTALPFLLKDREQNKNLRLQYSMERSFSIPNPDVTRPVKQIKALHLTDNDMMLRVTLRVPRKRADGTVEHVPQQFVLPWSLGKFNLPSTDFKQLGIDVKRPAVDFIKKLTVEYNAEGQPVLRLHFKGTDQTRILSGNFPEYSQFLPTNLSLIEGDIEVLTFNDSDGVLPFVQLDYGDSYTEPWQRYRFVQLGERPPEFSQMHIHSFESLGESIRVQSTYKRTKVMRHDNAWLALTGSNTNPGQEVLRASTSNAAYRVLTPRGTYEVAPTLEDAKRLYKHLWKGEDRRAKIDGREARNAITRVRPSGAGFANLLRVTFGAGEQALSTVLDLGSKLMRAEEIIHTQIDVKTGEVAAWRRGQTVAYTLRKGLSDEQKIGYRSDAKGQRSGEKFAWFDYLSWAKYTQLVYDAQGNGKILTYFEDPLDANKTLGWVEIPTDAFVDNQGKAINLRGNRICYGDMVYQNSRLDEHSYEPAQDENHPQLCAINGQAILRLHYATRVTAQLAKAELEKLRQAQGSMIQPTAVSYIRPQSYVQIRHKATGKLEWVPTLEEVTHPHLLKSNSVVTLPIVGAPDSDEAYYYQMTVDPAVQRVRVIEQTIEGGGVQAMARVYYSADEDDYEDISLRDLGVLRAGLSFKLGEALTVDAKMALLEKHKDDSEKLKALRQCGTIVTRRMGGFYHGFFASTTGQQQCLGGNDYSLGDQMVFYNPHLSDPAVAFKRGGMYRFLRGNGGSLQMAKSAVADERYGIPHATTVNNGTPYVFSFDAFLEGGTLEHVLLEMPHKKKVCIIGHEKGMMSVIEDAQQEIFNAMNLGWRNHWVVPAMSVAENQGGEKVLPAMGVQRQRWGTGKEIGIDFVMPDVLDELIRARLLGTMPSIMTWREMFERTLFSDWYFVGFAEVMRVVAPVLYLVTMGQVLPYMVNDLFFQYAVILMVSMGALSYGFSMHKLGLSPLWNHIQAPGIFSGGMLPFYWELFNTRQRRAAYGAFKVTALTGAGLDRKYQRFPALMQGAGALALGLWVASTLGAAYGFSGDLALSPGSIFEAWLASKVALGLGVTANAFWLVFSLYLMHRGVVWRKATEVTHEDVLDSFGVRYLAQTATDVDVTAQQDAFARLAQGQGSDADRYLLRQHQDALIKQRELLQADLNNMVRPKMEYDYSGFRALREVLIEQIYLTEFLLYTSAGILEEGVRRSHSTQVQKDTLEAKAMFWYLHTHAFNERARYYAGEALGSLPNLSVQWGTERLQLLARELGAELGQVNKSAEIAGQGPGAHQTILEGFVPRELEFARYRNTRPPQRVTRRYLAIWNGETGEQRRMRRQRSLT